MNRSLRKNLTFCTYDNGCSPGDSSVASSLRDELPQNVINNLGWFFVPIVHATLNFLTAIATHTSDQIVVVCIAKRTLEVT
jgi:hypothetical protein